MPHAPTLTASMRQGKYVYGRSLMIDAIGKFIIAATGGNAYLMLFFMSALPLVELRGAVIFLTGMFERSDFPSIYAALWCCIAGSTSVILPLLLITRPLLCRLKRTKFFGKIATEAERDLKRKALKAADNGKNNFDKTTCSIENNPHIKLRFCKNKKSYVDGSRFWGLFGFVAIPLPLTGVWTGSLIGGFIKLPIWKAALAIFTGNAVAAHIMLAIGYMVPKKYADIMLLAFLAAAVAIALGTLFIKLKRNERRAAK